MLRPPDEPTFGVVDLGLAVIVLNGDIIATHLRTNDIPPQSRELPYEKTGFRPYDNLVSLELTVVHDFPFLLMIADERDARPYH